MKNRRKIITNPIIKSDKQVAVGIKFPFSADRVFALNYSNRDQIKSNIMVWFLTNIGDRPLNVLYGGDILSLLFENTLENEVKTEMIRDKFVRKFPMVSLLSLDVSYNENTVSVKLSYSFNNDIDEISINFDR